MERLEQWPTMLVNIDIACPGLHVVIRSSSVSAVVASYNSDFAQYLASMTLQQSKIEVCPSVSKFRTGGSSHLADGNHPG
ncbi:hypothetical protein GALMADRAFT_223626 [Galerina marginata CBS 339.88]|uniref:Uncharacterized protein n=1 Tax=Galerina marginata (strain CBS 339.88) TaxID=685588 RepID=A0A067T8E9_GALM3|nr:hypothetical protein GALMADRAFT_223626 [Galerina marginata CBS 339.88]